MNQEFAASFVLVLPETFLAVAAMALLMLGVFRGEGSARLVSWLAIAALAVTALFLPLAAPGQAAAFGGLFVTDAFAVFMKILILLGTALALVMSIDFNDREQIAQFEYPVLFLFAAVGMMVMISASDLISLYIGLELQSLSLYVVAAFRRDAVKSTEAGLKYFVLGALSSGMLLYGASLIYGFSGATGFADIAEIMIGQAGDPPLGVIFGIVFMVAALAFKVSAAPFHMWTPDVYEGAPTPVTAFFSIAPKIAATALLVRVLIDPFGPLVNQWQQVVIAVAIASMLIGAFAAINQTNIKRLMAYSSIGHIGYALVGLAAGDETGVHGVLIYMAIYLFMNVAAFGVILCMRQQGRMVERIADLSGLSVTRPGIAAALAIAMFSMAGIPPLAGFFGKFYVFQAAIAAGLYTLAVIGVLTSVVAAFYYLRIVKLMYFDEPVEAFDRPAGRTLGIVITGSSLLILLFVVYMAPVVGWAGIAAAALFGG
ncbi:MAG: NADH-quinone oxidoreductase subunit NuoN [Rhodospirillales bacterium]|nr:NADH-quinone oxidoreductase subunit NuoN [Rhodospirillales bacterium]